MAATGFIVVDRAGEFIAWAAHMEVAKRRCDDDPNADRVETADGIALAFAPRWKFRGKK